MPDNYGFSETWIVETEGRNIKMECLRYGIIAIGYSRPECMTRLLRALEAADYKDDRVMLIVSIDNSGREDVWQAAEKCAWTHGEKVIRTYPERMGLRAHVLRCGDFLEEYGLDAVAVFEDDILPSPAFYNYMRQAVPFYQDNEKIAGISLYMHRWNMIGNLPFQPAYSSRDVYFQQFAQSWGQIWLRRQWKQFYKWYEGGNAESVLNQLPEHIRQWPDSSWLKYHIAYCVSEKKYFVYPYEALSTCYSELGENNVKTTHFQVPMQLDTSKEYCFDVPDKESVCYDCYFERMYMAKYIQQEEIKDSELTVDIYGTKGINRTRYLLSSKRYSYQCLKSYALDIKPHENNVILDVDGEGIYLYDQTQKGSIPPQNDNDTMTYYYRFNRGVYWLFRYKVGRILRRLKK